MNLWPLLAVSVLCMILAQRVVHSRLVDVPTLGVFDGTDLAVLAAAVVLLPFQQRLLPHAAGSVIGTLLVVNSVHVLGARLRPSRRALLVVSAAAAPLAARIVGGPAWVAIWTDNVVLACSVVAIAAVWTASGMSTGHIGAAAAALIVYDLLATWMTDVMSGFAADAASTVPAGLFRLSGEGGALGVGDVLVATLAATTFAETYGRRAGGWMTAAATVSIGATFAIPATVVPVMITLGPAIIIGRWMAAKPPTSVSVA